MLSAGERIVVLLNRAIGGESPGVSEEGVRQLQRLFAVAVALHPFQAEPELVHPHAAAPVNIRAKRRIR